MVKLLIGGSPCSFWSIAQSKNRETTATGQGWELFKNYLMVKELFRPDFFLYENNKSAAQAIKDQISRELGVPLQYINSALVSAQNRQRFYAHNFGYPPGPVDRGILLKDILDTGQPSKPFDYVPHKDTDIIINDNAMRLQRRDSKRSTVQGTHVNFPDGKTQTLQVAHVPKTFEAYSGRIVGRRKNEQGKREDNNADLEHVQYVEINKDPEKTNCLTTFYKDNIVAQKTSDAAGPVYEVVGGEISIKGKTYPIKLPDGRYIIRKLTVAECCRLQTLPDDYCRAVSASQAYKALGNGWTAEVIAHLLGYALAGVPKNEKLLVISMYDGIGTGRYVLDKLGFTNVEYHAFEIDKHAIKVAHDNYPDIRQHGDAFKVREVETWPELITSGEWAGKQVIDLEMERFIYAG